MPDKLVSQAENIFLDAVAEGVMNSTTTFVSLRYCSLFHSWLNELDSTLDASQVMSKYVKCYSLFIVRLEVPSTSSLAYLMTNMTAEQLQLGWSTDTSF